jgi:hypothetical protein
VIKFYWMIDATHVAGPFDTVDEANDALAQESDPVKMYGFGPSINSDKPIFVPKDKIAIVPEEWDEEDHDAASHGFADLIPVPTKEQFKHTQLDLFKDVKKLEDLSEEETKKMMEEIMEDCKDDERPCNICGGYIHENPNCPEFQKEQIGDQSL